MQKLFKQTLIISGLVGVFCISFPAYAHPGDVDSHGGHYCWTNCESWGVEYEKYHYHEKVTFSDQSKYNQYVDSTKTLIAFYIKEKDDILAKNNLEFTASATKAYDACLARKESLQNLIDISSQGAAMALSYGNFSEARYFTDERTKYQNEYILLDCDFEKLKVLNEGLKVNADVRAQYAKDYLDWLIADLQRTFYTPLPVFSEFKKLPVVTQPAKIVSDPKVVAATKGRLLLQVEDGGRIWYVSPSLGERYEVTFANALPLFEKLSLGISNSNLTKIAEYSEARTGDRVLAGNLKGKLLLQVEQGGRIWYVNPITLKRHEVTWENLMDLFRSLALGISDVNLSKIQIGSFK